MAAASLSFAFARVAIPRHASLLRNSSSSLRKNVLSRPSSSSPFSCGSPLIFPSPTSVAAVVRSFSASVRAISVGEKLPDASLSYFDKEGNLKTLSVEEFTKGKKVVLFAVPGAFTPTCSQKHLPGFLSQASELFAKGVDTIACVSVNDPFVMRAWGESVAPDGLPSSSSAESFLLLADGSALFTSAIGAQLDLTDKGLGVRSRRYAMLVEDGVVKVLNMEEGGAFTISGAEEILKHL